MRRVPSVSTEKNATPPPAPDTATRAVSTCSKCGALNSGKSSCCGRGGAWVGKCAKKVNGEFSYTWSEGIQSCQTESECECLSGHVACSCIACAPTWQPANTLCTSTEPSIAPVTKAPTSTCPKCGTLKSGKSSCCARGGSWYEECGSADSSKFDHSWGEGIRACEGESKLKCIYD